MESPSLFAELKRRNVHRAALFYAGASWLLMQIASQIFPFFDIPNWAVRLVVVALLIGFPFAMLFSWYFEWTPQGIKRESEIERSESITPATGKKMDRWIIGVLGLAVIVLLLNQFVLHRFMPSAQPGLTVAATEKSIAVLPFENLSADPDNAYFAQGIQDEILTRLAKIGALKVISRTSTAHYASSPDNLPEIAKQLGVANILEGSVQKIGDAVHVNVQLIRAATDDHLWAESYDRKLDNIFGVEGEVANAIAQQLNAKLTGAEQEAVALKPTDNPAAYDAYLRSLAVRTEGYDYATTRKVVAALTEAVRLDPKFALAWAELAGNTGYLYFNGVDPALYTAESVKQATDTALRLQPDLAEAQLAQGEYRYRVLRDFAGAQQDFEAAVQRFPNNQIAWQLLGLSERRQGKWEQALQHLEQASKLGPRDSGLMTSIGGETLSRMRRHDEERDWLDRALALSPENSLAIFYKVISYQVEGRLEDAARLLDPIPKAGIDPGLAVLRGYQRLLERRFPDAIGELQPLLAQPEASLDAYGPQAAVTLGFAQRYAGQTAQARATFEQLIAQLKVSGGESVDDSQKPVMLALAYAGAGQQKAALEQAKRAVALYRNDAIYRPTAELALAQVQALAGDYAAAVAGLEQSLKIPSGVTIAQLRLDPAWDTLRGEPGFQKLIVDGEAAAKASVKP